MNVPGVTHGSGAMAMSAASPMAGGKFDNQFQSAMSSVASLLGTSVASLQSSTQSLSQIAAAKGVGEPQLESAVKAGLQASGTQLGGNRLDNIAHRIATRSPRHHQHRGIQPTGRSTNSGRTGATSGTATVGWSAGTFGSDVDPGA